ncbi:site-specific integrase [Sphingomonas sp. BK069]|uniref:tyrosine-type recombinase/integrase n=1 Tax=Sphingomonas sp. BK069 TaxID=2586979 RepID=UPI001617553D|nr:site-specific integrase [Sphingomonas sp. BK069]MBB3349828.1 integrase [Sphingomonas sp. BK069]
MRTLPELVCCSRCGDGHLLPKSGGFLDVYASEPTVSDSYLLPNASARVRKALLDGNFARRSHPARPSEYVIWDTELAGFGLRVRPSGSAFWTVRLRHRGKQRRVTLGRVKDVDATVARAQARRLLAEVVLDGLPKRAVVKVTPTLAAYVESYWTDIARYWKPSTAKRNRDAWRRDLAPVFAQMRVAEVLPADVIRWRDDCAGSAEARYNRAVPVLASLFKYAEALHLRRKGSNPCRGLPRYPREAKERYLLPLEYRRLGAALREAEVTHPAQVAIVRLLLYTGARLGEIQGLRWEWVRPPRLDLPDSKTGAKTIWLNSQAVAILEALSCGTGSPFVFPNKDGTAPIAITAWWTGLRGRCSMPNLRIHDLRHSFASTAIMANVPLATISKLLGHLLPETTARYAHLADEVIADAAQRISGSLAQALGIRP